MRFRIVFFLYSLLLLAASPAGANSPSGTPSIQDIPDKSITLFRYVVLNRFPHDPDAFTQGLVYNDGIFYESTGKYGRSTIRKTEVLTGKIIQSRSLEDRFFGEGMCIFEGKIFQLTWKSKTGFIYQKKNLLKIKTFTHPHEGWGLTHDGQRLIASDGTSTLRFLDPDTFKTTRTISVSASGKAVLGINELEYIKGLIYANLYQTDQIAMIDPGTGLVLGVILADGLYPKHKRPNTNAVLNGIAYDEEGDRLFLTGKNWPYVFEVRLRKN